MTTVGMQSYFDAAQRNRQSAHACAALGWVVVPWKMDGDRKRPTLRNWQVRNNGGLRGQEVAEHWVNNPGDIPGVVCGSESGVWVLDIDPRNGGDASYNRLDSIGALGNTFRVSTPGGGWHLYFAWPGGEINIPNQIPLEGYPGIDIKGTAGFAVAPGAMVEINGELKEYGVPVGAAPIASAPDWLIELVRGDGPAWITNGDHSNLDGTQDPDEAWLQLEFNLAASALPGEQHAALRRFVFQMRVRGLKRDVALREAERLCSTFQASPDREPWTDRDAESMVANTWARIAPDTVDDQLTAWASVQTPEPAGGAGSVTAAPLPPPRSAAVIGEPPKAIGLDDENAQDLRLFAQDRLIWIEGADWQVWDSTRWREDAGLVRHAIVRELGLEMVRRAGAAGLSEEDRKKMIGRYNRLGTVQGRDACLNYARHLFAVPTHDLDRDVWALNTRSGLVDLRTGSVRPAVPSDLITQITSCEYREGETDETWEHVIRQAIPDDHDRAWLQRWMGYCLTGLTTEKAILAMHGPANSGKSTVTEPLARALGTYAISWDSETIVANSRVNVPEALFRARASRLVIVNEMKAGTRLDEGVIKSATGTDTVTARALYHGSINYRPQFKLWIHTNHIPNTKDDALLMRMLFLRMVSQLDRDKRDPAIKRHLEEDAGAAVVWWAVQGLLSAFGKPGELGVGLGRPAHSDEEVEDHALRSDPIRRFIADSLEVVSDDLATSWDDLVAAYHYWCLHEGLKPLGTTTFAHALKERGLVKTYERFGPDTRKMAVRGWSVRGANIAV